MRALDWARRFTPLPSHHPPPKVRVDPLPTWSRSVKYRPISPPPLSGNSPNCPTRGIQIFFRKMCVSPMVQWGIYSDSVTR